MMKTEKFPVAQIYVPVKRRATLVQARGTAQLFFSVIPGRGRYAASPESRATDTACGPWIPGSRFAHPGMTGDHLDP